jgi:hypothetical protein
MASCPICLTLSHLVPVDMQRWPVEAKPAPLLSFYKLHAAYRAVFVGPPRARLMTGRVGAVRATSTNDAASNIALVPV